MAPERDEPLTATLLAPSRAEPGAPIRSGILVLANTLLGAGMLGLPAAFGKCGYLIGTLFILCFAVCACTGLHLLSEAADLAGRPASFNRLANAAVPGGAIFFDLAIAIKCFGVATSYLIVVGDNLPRAMAGFGVTTPLLLHRRTWILASLFAAAPLAFMRRISALRHTSTAALLCVLAITLMVFLFALPTDIPLLSPTAHGQPAHRGTYVAIGTASNSMRALPIFVFSFTCHQNIVSISNELARPTPRRVLTQAAGAVGAAATVYLVLAHAGYYTFGDMVDADILSSYPSSNTFVAVARCLIAIVVTCCYPLQAHPSRGCIASIVAATQRAARARAEARRQRGTQRGAGEGRPNTGRGAGSAGEGRTDTGGAARSTEEGILVDGQPRPEGAGDNARVRAGDGAGNSSNSSGARGADSCGDGMAVQARGGGPEPASFNVSAAGGRTGASDGRKGYERVPPSGMSVCGDGSRLGGGSEASPCTHSEDACDSSTGADDDAASNGGVNTDTPRMDTLHKDARRTETLHMIISACFVLASGSIALVVTDLGVVLSVVGATGSTTVSYILPGLTYFRLSTTPKRWVGLALMCAGLVLMPLSLALIALRTAGHS